MGNKPIEREHVGDALDADYRSGRMGKGFYYVEIEQPDKNKIVFGIDYYDGEKFLFNKVRGVNKRVPWYEEYLQLADDSYFYHVILDQYGGKFENWVKEKNGRETR